MEFCQTWTDDGVQLSGMVHAPQGQTRLALGVVLVHGFSSRFYSQVVLGLAGGLARRGVLVVAGNNRGHDIGALLRRRQDGPLLAGAAWERIEEAPFDVAAWIDVAVARGARKVALVGHSLGALKCALYCLERDDPRVAALVLASPPLRPAAAPAAPDPAAEDRAIVRLLPFPVSAQTLRSRQALADRLQPLEMLSRLRVPTLILYGELEPEGGTEDDLARYAGYGADTAYFPGADHNYTGHEDEVAGGIAGWLYGLDMA
jgi:pimeloyl-ACP methyl ester carboxylesterase